MIDTVVLILSKNTYQITEPEKFTPSAHWTLSEQTRMASGIQSKQNPSKRELRSGIYKPRLLLANRINATGRRETMLKMELSLPKLFYGNNFDELQYKDFNPLIQKLVTVLATMGVHTTADALSQAPVYTIHYSKNVALTDGSIPYSYINKIKEANIKLSLDTNQTDYRNEGHSYKWHCNAYEVVFYDKIRDLEKAKQSDRRAVEKDSTVQLGLFNQLHKRKKLEILRIEVRLNKRNKMKQLFKALNIKIDLTFKKLFKPSIAKKVLLHYLDELESKRPILLDYKATSDKALLCDLVFNNPDMRPKEIFQLIGLKHMLHTMSLRELRTIFARHDKRSWYRLMATVDKVKLPMAQDIFGEIRENLEAFKPVRLAT